MTKLQNNRTLCPHLAAAALWTTSRPSRTRNWKAARFARAAGAALDDLMAL